VDSLYKAAVDLLSQNQQTVQCDVLTDIGQTVEECSEHSDTESRGGTVLGANRHSV